MKNNQNFAGDEFSNTTPRARKPKNKIGFFVALFILVGLYSVAFFAPEYFAKKKISAESTKENLINPPLNSSNIEPKNLAAVDLSKFVPAAKKDDLPASDKANPFIDETPITKEMPLLPPTDKPAAKIKAPELPEFVTNALKNAETSKGPLGEMARAYVRGASDLRAGETILFQKAKNKNAVGFVDEIIGRGPAAQCGSKITLSYKVLAYDMMPLYSYPDSSAPITLQLGRDIIVPGFAEGLLGTKAGGKRHISVPAVFAYQDQRFEQNLVPNKTPLVYDAAILKVEDTIAIPARWYVLDEEEGAGQSALCGMQVEFLYRFTAKDKWEGPYRAQLGAREIPFAIEIALLHMREGGTRRAFIAPEMMQTDRDKDILKIKLSRDAEIFLQLKTADW